MNLKEILAPFLRNALNKQKIDSLLESAGVSDKYMKAFHAEEQASFDRLKAIADSNLGAPAQEEAIRLFLKQRWTMIGATDLAYLSFPHSPLNQLCHQLAQEIVKPQESLAKVLMPTLEVDDYLLASDDLIGLTEVKIDGKPSLAYWNFLISEDGKKIIPIHPWFEAQAGNASEFFNHLYTVDHKLIPLSEAEKSLLRFCAMPTSDDFFEEFTLRKKLISAKGTLAEATLKLIDGLRENGAGHKGTSNEAHDDVFDCIREFAQVLKTLPKDQRKLIEGLKGPMGQDFMHFWRIISGEEGKKRPKNPLTCTMSNASHLRDILEKYPDQFSAIKLEGRAQDPNQPEARREVTPFTDLLNRIQQKISERQQALTRYLNRASVDQGLAAMSAYYPSTFETVTQKQVRYKEHLLLAPGKSLSPAKNLSVLSFDQRMMCAEEFEAYLQGLTSIKLQALLREAIQQCSPMAQTLIAKPYIGENKKALHQAVVASHIDFVRTWIALGRDLNYGINTADRSPLYIAIDEQEWEIAILLIQAGADCAPGRGGVPLLHELVYGSGSDRADIVDPMRVQVLDALLAREGISVDDVDGNGDTALMKAIRASDMDFFRALIAKNATPNCKNNRGYSSLMLGIHGQNPFFNIVLIQAGADLFEPGIHNHSPLAETVLTTRQDTTLRAWLDYEKNIQRYDKGFLTRVLNYFVNVSVYPKADEKYVKMLIAAGVALVALVPALEKHQIHFTTQEIMGLSNVDELKTLHGFSGLCRMAALKEDSPAALKLYARCVEISLRRMNNAGADLIATALQSNSLHTLSQAIAQTRAQGSAYAYQWAPADPWSDLPERLKGLVQSYLIDPQSAVSKKRSYLEYS